MIISPKQYRLIASISTLSLVVAVVGVAVALHQQSSTTSADTSDATRYTIYNQKIDHPNTDFTIVVEGEKQIKGPTTIRVKKGDVVRVNINAQGDEESKLELDGYGIITETNAQAPGGFSFVADKVGSFGYYAVEDTDGGDASAATPERQKLGTIEVQ